MDVVAVIGLGYVGLPLAVAFGKLLPTIGYDLSASKLGAYRQHRDPSGTVSSEDLRTATQLEFTADPADLRRANILIIAVPTPIDAARNPDFTPLVRASEHAAGQLKPGDLVVYESTVYPGATEEVCIPVLERISGLRWKRDFSVGYSPERINPGDHEHTLANTIKVVAGDCPATLERVASPVCKGGGRGRAPRVIAAGGRGFQGD
jgi:UDP-N-acetyl-D-galactosamine dehydrogenase